MENNKFRDTIGEVHGNGNSAYSPVNVDNDWQENSS